MSFGPNDLTLDGFLDGKIKILQPIHGYRAATDPVYLAAAIPAIAGQKVLELGCGVGVALACLGSRVKNLELFGLEIQPDYAALGRENMKENHQNCQIIDGDISQMPPMLKDLNFDHVMANPPFFNNIAHTIPLSAGKTTAHVGNSGTVEIWINAALRRLKPGGIVTMLHRAEALDDILVSLREKSGDIKILPISSRKGKPAQRVIVQARKSSKGPLRLLAPFVVHKGLKHSDLLDDFSDISTGILRHGDPLPLC